MLRTAPVSLKSLLGLGMVINMEIIHLQDRKCGVGNVGSCVFVKNWNIYDLYKSILWVSVERGRPLFNLDINLNFFVVQVTSDDKTFSVSVQSQETLKRVLFLFKLHLCRVCLVFKLISTTQSMTSLLAIYF